ncbi:YfbM family protein [Streptomyces sp. YIM S03343]
MIGEYLRLTPADLDKAIANPEWAVLLAEAAQDAAEVHPDLRPADARHYSTYKTWDLIRHLVVRAEFPVNVVQGEELFPDPEDWVYGPPRYLPPARVRQAAERLLPLTYDLLITGVDPSDLTELEVYPLHWDTPGSLDWARPWYEGLTQFFEAAALDGDAMIIWLT